MVRDVQNPRTDLQVALAFVIGRVEQEAQRSGSPLEADERELLVHLPSAPGYPGWVTAEFWQIVPRDFAYERLCKLAKAAYSHDLRAGPASVRYWDFAMAALRLEHHPMLWLLQSAGMKQRRPLRDCLFLLACAILLVISGLSLIIVLEEPGAFWPSMLCVAITAISAAALIRLYQASSRYEKTRLRQVLEKSRRDLFS